MPRRSQHIRFDRYLVERGIITEETLEEISDLIHQFMDSGLKEYGPNHQYLDPKHYPEAIRMVVRSVEDDLPQHLKTDAVRIAYGHIELDKSKERYGDVGTDFLIRNAYQNYRRKGYHRTRFRTSK